MRYNKLLESLDSLVSRKDLEVRRYSLSDVISESYRLCYESEEGSNFHKLAEANVEYLRNNPKEDLSELSTKIAQLKSLKESISSGKIKDSKLFEEKVAKSYFPVEVDKNSDLWKSLISKCKKYNFKIKDTGNKVSGGPNKGFNIVHILGSKDDIINMLKDEGLSEFINDIGESLSVPVRFDGGASLDNWIKVFLRSHTFGSADAMISYLEEYGMIDELEDEFQTDVRGAIEEYFDELDESLEESSEECKNELPDGDQPYKDPKDYPINEADDPEISDEELEELAKHLEEYRKKKSQNEALDEAKPVVEEFTYGEDEEGLFNIYVDGDLYTSFSSKEDAKEAGWSFDDEEEKEVECDSPTRSWSEMKESLSNYSKLSTKKAFYKTFKKLSEKLSEGTALTRQESLDLYKATNSAMTQLSVELEHNPEFLETFNEATKILSEDESSLLNALRSNKGPSKKTMKSLSKFAETIFYEDEEEVLYDEEEETLEDPEIIEEPSEEESEEKSEEEEAFDQDYADARQEVHDELVAAHGTSEDPAVQEKIDQDAIEVKVIQGEDYEEAAEEVAAERAAAEGLSDEEVSAEDSEEIEDEEVEANENLDLEDITPDELEELKKKLKEMRESK